MYHMKTDFINTDRTELAEVRVERWKFFFLIQAFNAENELLFGRSNG